MAGAHICTTCTVLHGHTNSQTADIHPTVPSHHITQNELAQQFGEQCTKAHMGDGGPQDDAAHTGVVRGLGPGPMF